ncbi:hypothetical protein [Methylorubrum suomiense]|uniref:Uncharacterized protein n=1 Tax=Methylorubrum suomiense TaxID=144191 RepID=A0ABQ4V6Q4_9HYPH|nr:MULTISPECIES: hypothetical protein [Methylobacteriaceae]GJE78172.1 hypothetical protein BGCPKDLD_4783 [Methylorubrum suomiense]
MNALPFAPRRRGTALLNVLLGLASGAAFAQAARDAADARGHRTAGAGTAGDTSGREAGAPEASGQAPDRISGGGRTGFGVSGSEGARTSPGGPRTGL